MVEMARGFFAWFVFLSFSFLSLKKKSLKLNFFRSHSTFSALTQPPPSAAAAVSSTEKSVSLLWCRDSSVPVSVCVCVFKKTNVHVHVHNIYEDAVDSVPHHTSFFRVFLLCVSI